MQTRTIYSRMPRLLQQLGLGVALGLLQLLLFMLGFSRFGLNLQLNNSFLAGLALFFVFGVLAGLLTARREERALAGAKAGFVTGCIATVVVLLALFIALLLNPPHAQVSSRPYPVPIGSIVAIFIFLVWFLNAVGTLLAMLGGIIGRAAGRRRARKRSQL